jgi:hypothetical protein
MYPDLSFFLKELAACLKEGPPRIIELYFIFGVTISTILPRRFESFLAPPLTFVNAFPVNLFGVI